MEPSAVASAAGGVHGFPAPLTSFVGRVAAVGEVAGLLGEYRLVTVTGPGGVGKTRLAGEVTRQLAGRFADGAWLAELDAVRYYAALKMAEHGLLTAPNMAVGAPFNVGLTAAAVTGAGSTALPGLPTDGGGIAGVHGGTAVVREPDHQSPRPTVSGVAGL